MWRSRKYFEGLIAKSLYEPLTARERRRMDKAIASDASLGDTAVRLKSMVERLPAEADITAPDLLPDLRIAIAVEDSQPAPRGVFEGRNRWATVAVFAAMAVVAFMMLTDPMGATLPVETPPASLMQQAILQSEALIAEHQPGEALRLLETALVAQSADPDVAKAHLMLADLSFEESLYTPALEAYTAVQSSYPEYVLALDEDARFRIAERVELLDECSVDGFDTLMAYNAALREADGRFERLERVAVRAASDPHGLLAARVLWSMAEALSESDSLTDADARVAALERVRDRCSNSVVAARASFEAGHTYEREVGDNERAVAAYRLAGAHSVYEAAAATAIARLEPR